MYRIDDPSASPTLPAPEAALTEGYWTEGNPGSGILATLERASWFNMVQEELRAIVVAGGLTPSKTTYNQVLSAIKRIGQNTVLLSDTGAVNAYAAANTTPLVAGTWIDGVVQAVKIAHTNTGASTYAPDGLTAIPIYGLGLQPLQGGELLLNSTAILMHLTIAGVNSGNPICVLMECAGGAQQVPPATQPLHAMQLGQATGRLLKRTVFTSSATFTALATTNSIRAIVVGGGGAGGGAQATSSGQLAVGSGGASGAYTEIGASTGFAGGIAVTVGAGGAAASGANGGNGGQSSLGTLATAPGGGGGPQGLVTATGFNFAQSSTPAIPGVVGAVTYSLTLGGTATAGGAALNGAVMSGSGAGGYLGQGGSTPTVSGLGVNATGYGAGGSGAASGASVAARVGGAGSSGLVIIEEYT